MIPKLLNITTHTQQNRQCSKKDTDFFVSSTRRQRLLVWGCFVLLVSFFGVGCLPKATALKRKSTQLKKKKSRKTNSTRRAFVHSARAYHYYILGRTYSYQRRHQKAIKLYMQAILSDWDSPFLYYSVGREFLSLRKLKKASHWLNRALKKSRKTKTKPLAPALYLLARIHWRQGNLGAAERHYRRALRSEPTYLPPYQDLLALLSLKKHKLREQIRLSQAMIKHAPHRFEGHLALATYLEKRGKHWLAIRAYRNALNRNPSHRKARFRVARLYERQRRWSNALNSYELLLDYHPSYAEARILAAAIRLKRRRRYDRSIARAQFRLMLRSQPVEKRAQWAQHIGEVLLKRKLAKESLRWFAVSLRLRPGHTGTLFAMSEAYSRLKSHRLALKTMRRIRPTSKELSMRLMFRELKLLVKIGQRKVAKRLMRLNRTRYKSDLKTRLLLSQAFVSWATQKELGEEIQYFRKEFKRSVDNIAYLFHLSYLYYRKKAYPHSSALLNRILKLRPNHAASLNFLALLYMQQKKHLDKAEKLVRRALKAEPGNGIFLGNYGWILYLRKRYRKANQVLNTARSLQPDNPRILRHLGILRRRQGRLREALLLFHRARKLQPDSRVRKQLARQIRRLQRRLRARTRRHRKQRARASSKAS